MNIHTRPTKFKHLSSQASLDGFSSTAFSAVCGLLSPIDELGKMQVVDSAPKLGASSSGRRYKHHPATNWVGIEMGCRSTISPTFHNAACRQSDLCRREYYPR